MGAMRSSVDGVALSAWRGQLAATGARRGLRIQLLHHRQALLPRFAAVYRQLRTLPQGLRKTLQRRWGASLAGVALLLALQPGTSEAATFTAGTAADLIAALNEANSNGTTDTITLTADITLIAVDNTAFGSSGLPVVTSPITIAGQGHTIHRDSGAPDFRLLAVSNTGDLTLQDTTVSGGRNIVFGYYNSDFGGGIVNNGSLTLTNSTVSGNSARYGGGGGIANFGSLTLSDSTVSGNSARYGGGIDNFAGSLTLTNSTVSGNLAVVDGGCIENFAGSLTLSRSLVSGNATFEGAGIGAEVNIFSSSSFTGTFDLLGHNGLTTAEALAGFTPDPSDIIATSDGNTPTALVDILDTTLQNNGGPTLTHNLVAGSPAIDAAGATCELTTDQRGAPRPVDGNGDGVAACDIGAVEFSATPAALEVSIDIKPGAFPNTINPRNKGVIPVALLTTPTFDATAIDPRTVRFGATGTEAAPVHATLADVDGDGDTDLLLHFRTQDTGIQCGDTTASVTGETLDGQQIEGTDAIRTVGCKKKG